MAKAKAGRKAGSTVDPNETKAQKFARLANKRVPKALKDIANIGKLSGTGYERTPEQAQKIVTALETAVKVVKDKFAGVKEAAQTFSV